MVGRRWLTSKSRGDGDATVEENACKSPSNPIENYLPPYSYQKIVRALEIALALACERFGSMLFELLRSMSTSGKNAYANVNSQIERCANRENTFTRLKIEI